MLQRIESKKLGAVFLEGEPSRAGSVPLTPFMIHIWRQTEPNLQIGDPAAREQFLYWFYGKYYRLKRPYCWPVPPPVLAWLNTPAPGAPRPAAEGLLLGQEAYLTRFMARLRSELRPETEVSSAEGFLRFLVWFCFDCAPAWNLPRALLPDALARVLNRPLREESLPLTVGMAVRAQALWPEVLPEPGAAEDASLLTLSFRILPEVLRAGDPRLLPEFVTQFWLGQAGRGIGLTRYEYTAARACLQNVWEPGGWTAATEQAVRQWFDSHCTRTAPYGVLFSRRQKPEGGGAAAVEPSVRPAPRVLFVYRDLRTVSGLSRAGEGAAQALRLGPLPVVEIDYNLRRERLTGEYRHNERQLCHAEAAVHMLNLNPEHVPECLMNHLGKLDDADYIIGQFAWELPELSSPHECGLSLVHEIWLGSEFLREVYARRVDLPLVVMGQVVEPAPVRAPFTKAALGISEASYVFLVSFDAGSVIERKNPLAAVRAFRRAFPSGAERAVMILKTKDTERHHGARDVVHWRTTLEEAAADARILVIDAAYSEQQLAGLFELCDCYVSLHRSEGFGYGPADALARGKPAIVTAYSGVTDFCTAATALLVDFRLEEVQPEAYPFMDRDRTYLWASPNIGTAAAHMRRLLESPEEGQRVGAEARRLMSERYSVKALSERYVARLRQLGFC